MFYDHGGRMSLIVPMEFQIHRTASAFSANSMKNSQLNAGAG
jgi:hypothetical protein